MKDLESWNVGVKRLLKAEMIKRGITSEELSRLLFQRGVVYSKSSIDSKISRGKFSAVFLIQCLLSLNCKNMDLSQITDVINSNEK